MTPKLATSAGIWGTPSRAHLSQDPGPVFSSCRQDPKVPVIHSDPSLPLIEYM